MCFLNAITHVWWGMKKLLSWFLQLHECCLQAFANAQTAYGKSNLPIIKTKKRELTEKSLGLEPLSDQVNLFPSLWQCAFIYAADCFELCIIFLDVAFLCDTVAEQCAYLLELGCWNLAVVAYGMASFLFFPPLWMLASGAFFGHVTKFHCG